MTAIVSADSVRTYIPRDWLLEHDLGTRHGLWLLVWCAVQLAQQNATPAQAAFVERGDEHVPTALAWLAKATESRADAPTDSDFGRLFAGSVLATTASTVGILSAAIQIRRLSNESRGELAIGGFTEAERWLNAWHIALFDEPCTVCVKAGRTSAVEA